MDIKAIRSFQSIVRTGSFREAAREMRYTQSTITLQIQKLESELGIKLLERGKKVSLTQAGKLFHEKSFSLTKEYDDLYNSVTKWVDGDSGFVRLGVTEPTVSHRLPKILQSFMKQYPKVQYSIKSTNLYLFNQQIRDGLLDIAICTTPEIGAGNVFEPLFIEEMALLIPDSHRLANQERIYLRDLKDENILVTTPECNFRRKLESALHELGGTPYNRIEIGSLLSLRFYVEAGFGVAILPSILATPAPPGTLLRKLEDTSADLVTGMLIRKDPGSMNSVTLKLAQHLRKWLAKSI